MEVPVSATAESKDDDDSKRPLPRDEPMSTLQANTFSSSVV